MAEIRIQDLHVDVGGRPIVRGVNFTLEQGGFLSLLGPSGCGKTTILRAIAGLAPVRQGEIRIGGERIVAPQSGISVPTHRRNLGMVFQSYAIWPHMTVAENVGYPLRLRGVAAAEVRTRIGEMLEIVGLADFARRPATDLSGGQQQRVAIARALIARPRVLLLDEPLSNLDSRLREQMDVELRRIQRQTGVTTIFVTHDQSEALSLADRIVLLREGRVEQSGTPADIYRRPDTAFANWFIGKSNRLTGRVEALLHTTGDNQRRARVVIDDIGHAVLARLGAGVFEVGQPVSLCVRPEDIVVGTAGIDVARVTDIEYLGDRHRCRALLGRFEFSFYSSARHTLQAGSDVSVAFEQDALVAFGELSTTF